MTRRKSGHRTQKSSAKLTNLTIQNLVDAAARRGGGTVKIRAGIYHMHDALHLRSGVHLVGEPGVVLKKVPSVSSSLIDCLGFGHYEFRVAEPDRFRVGMGVHLLDDNAGGFYTTVATITDKIGDTFFINRPFSHDYGFLFNGRAVSVYSLIEGDGVQDVSVTGLSLDGNNEKEPFQLNGCRGGGIFLIMSHRVSIRNVEIHHYRGDALSFQQCSDIRVESCEIHHNTASGLHPGSGSVRYVMRKNHLHNNGGYGIFYCLRTTHSICEENLIHHNHLAGISIGERDTDHLIRSNLISNNAGPGIDFRVPNRQSGDRTLVLNNTLRNNCTRFGAAEIVIPRGLANIHLAENIIEPTGGVASAVSVESGVREISAVNNQIAGHPQQSRDFPAGLVKTSAPARLPSVGPAALALDGARHLRVDALQPWER